MSKQQPVANVALQGAVALGLAVACSCSSASTPSTSSSPINVCDAPETVSLAVQDGCDLASATFVADMAQKGASGALTFQIVSVNGGSIAQGQDTWTIKITDANCQPVDGAKLTIKAWMPEHNHGWLEATSTPQGGGAYEIGDLYLFMDGFWQITFTATTAATTDAAAPVTDSTVFSFCLDD
jgi:nitrogen fixation protein FixH